jgi:DNA topoisomerase IB
MINLAPDQLRVLNEYDELKTKITKHVDFVMFSNKFKALEQAEQDRMRRQIKPMMEYSAILLERITAFPPTTVYTNQPKKCELSS